METKLKQSLLNKCKSEEEKIELRQSFVSAYKFRTTLEAVLEDKIDTVHRNQIVDRKYEEQWAFKQASDNGYQRAMKEILSFLQ